MIKDNINYASSVISVIGYNKEQSQLKIVFVSGLVYIYYKVPEEMYEQMKASSSKGTYFNEHIKGNFLFTREN